jgi:RNA polymerase sigma-70 factor (ECF subfamily)
MMVATQLVRDCQDGQASAFQTVYALYRPAALRTAHHIIGEEDLAEDAVQEAFIRAFRSIRALRRPEAFANWFHRMVVHAAVYQLRHHPQEVSLSLAAELGEDWNRRSLARDPEDDAIAHERNEAVLGALARLDAESRAVVVLRYYSGFTERRIAVLTVFPLGTVKSRLSRARAKLQSMPELGRLAASDVGLRDPVPELTSAPGL